MPGKVAKIGTFSDWVGLFDDWRKDIGVNHDEIADFKFDTLYGAIETDEIQFGSYKGRRKWENLRQVPTQQMRDAMMNMIVYQGDTEFASVEQQRYLFESAPTDWDRRAITRVMIEEMRHGWQMCALLIDHFGYSGKVEAQKMLERRASKTSACWARSMWTLTTGWTFSPTPTSLTVMENSSYRCSNIRHSRRLAVPCHTCSEKKHSTWDGQRRPTPHCGSWSDSGLADSEVSQQVDF